MLTRQVEFFSKSQVTASPKQVLLYIKQNSLRQISEALKTLDYLIIDFWDEQGTYLHVSWLGCLMPLMANIVSFYEI